MFLLDNKRVGIINTIAILCFIITTKVLNDSLVESGLFSWLSLKLHSQFLDGLIDIWILTLIKITCSK